MSEPGAVTLTLMQNNRILKILSKKKAMASSPYLITAVLFKTNTSKADDTVFQNKLNLKFWALDHRDNEVHSALDY